MRIDSKYHQKGKVDFQVTQLNKLEIEFDFFFTRILRFRLRFFWPKNVFVVV